MCVWIVDEMVIGHTHITKRTFIIVTSSKDWKMKTRSLSIRFSDFVARLEEAGREHYYKLVRKSYAHIVEVHRKTEKDK